MFKKYNINNKLSKIIDILDSKDNKLFNNNVVFLVKDIGYTDYVDNEGNSVSDAIKKYSIINSKGKILKPSIVLIDVIDNSYLESILYQK